MTDTPMTAGWEPSEEMMDAARSTYWSGVHNDTPDIRAALKAVRPLIIAEAKPEIEAAAIKAERKRILDGLPSVFNAAPKP